MSAALSRLKNQKSVFVRDVKSRGGETPWPGLESEAVGSVEALAKDPTN